ncbi:hypothetical protein AAC387_Pa07g0241 [Persea americana]
MDALPDAIVQFILSHISNVKDVSACNCVSKRWKESIPFIRSLYFPRGIFDDKMVDGDEVIGRMISSALCLEELIMYCPFSPASLASWLSTKSQSLKHLELRMNSITENKASTESSAQLDPIDAAKGLETLKLWGVLMTQTPKWSGFQRLHSLEIVGARLKDSVLSETIRACPNLTNLTLLGCDGFRSVSIELQQLEQCRLDFYGLGDCAIALRSPKLQQLEIQGCSWIYVEKSHLLRSLSIANNSGKVCKVELGGRLPALEFLTIRGVQWCWSAISHVLQCANEVKQLVMKIEFTGDNELQPFPEIDFVEFFNNHPKLCKFEIHGAMFAALCQKKSLRSLDSKFSIPCLEEVLITVRSPLNPEQKLSTLESLVKHSKKLKKMVIRASQMKNCHTIADEFFEEVLDFKYKNLKIVRVE